MFRYIQTNWIKPFLKSAWCQTLLYFNLSNVLLLSLPEMSFLNKMKRIEARKLTFYSLKKWNQTFSELLSFIHSFHMLSPCFTLSINTFLNSQKETSDHSGGQYPLESVFCHQFLYVSVFNWVWVGGFRGKKYFEEGGFFSHPRMYDVYTYGRSVFDKYINRSEFHSLNPTSSHGF